MTGPADRPGRLTPHQAEVLGRAMRLLHGRPDRRVAARRRDWHFHGNVVYVGSAGALGHLAAKGYLEVDSRLLERSGCAWGAPADAVPYRATAFGIAWWERQLRARADEAAG